MSDELQTLPTVIPYGLPSVMETMHGLKTIRTFVVKELVEGIDFGTIPGTGNKKTLLLPGAQKIQMFLNVFPEYRIDASELGAGHVEFRVRTWLISRTSREKVGSGVGSCSTMESKYRYRNAQRSCPECGQSSIVKTKKGRNPGSYWCVPDKGGCGQSFAPNSKEIEGQTTGKVENENIHDQRNTVLKMAKKRSLVDASLGLACLADQFTQDMDDVYDLDGGEVVDVVPASTPRRHQPPDQIERSPEREIVKDHFRPRDQPPASSRPASPGGDPKPEPWQSLVDRRVREVNEEWHNELAMSNMPTAKRKDLIGPEEVINGLVKRAIAAQMLTEADVSIDGKRDLPKARRALERLHSEKPRKIEASLEKYLAGKLQEGLDGLKDTQRQGQPQTAPPGKGEAYEESLSDALSN